MLKIFSHGLRGIAMWEKSFPFAKDTSRGVAMCLCEKSTERKCSSIAFWRVTTTVANELRKFGTGTHV